jgi:hypothetical protein
MKTIIPFLRAFCTLLMLCICRLAAQNESVSTTISALPDYDTGSGMAARINTLTVALDKDTLHAKPGQTVGWGFKIQWQSNAGDRISFGTSTCAGDLSPVSSGEYTDIIGVIGGNVDGHVAAGTSWETAFVPNTAGLGSVTISPDATPGAQFFGEIRLTFSIHDNSADVGKFLATRTIILPVAITVDSPDPLMLQDQSITFDPIAAKTLGDAPFLLTASSTSGLPVQLISLFPDICTVTGNTVTVHQAGTCVIMAEQTGNAAYNPALPVSQTIIIHKQPATISFTGSTERNYTGGEQTFGSSTTPAGLPVTLLYNGESTAPVMPGIYLAEATIDHPDYAGTTSALLTITDNTPPVIPTFLTWQNQHFTTPELLNPAISGLAADPDQDGHINLFEYAFGLDPKAAPTPAEQAALPRMSSDFTDGNATVAFELPTTVPGDVTIIVEASSSLASQSWQEIARRAGNAAWTGSATAFTAPPINSRSQILITESGLSQPLQRRFYRLQVISSP